MNNQHKGTALITGASRGIGKACAIQLAKDGYDIILCHRKPSESADDAKAKVEKLGKTCKAVLCDVGDFSATKEKFADLQEMQQLKVVVNSAGIIDDSPLVTMNEDSWSNVVRTNLDSIFNVTKHAIFQFMKQKDGCVINISSVSGIYGNASQTNYSASKAGIIGFTKALAKEVGPFNIRANVVAPGFISTDMTDAGLSEKQKKDITKKISLRRIGESSEVAHLVSFLCSNNAKYITGQVFQIDGGIIL